MFIVSCGCCSFDFFRREFRFRFIILQNMSLKYLTTLTLTNEESLKSKQGSSRKINTYNVACSVPTLFIYSQSDQKSNITRNSCAS